MSKFKLRPSISEPEKVIKEKIGTEKWETIKNNTINNNNNRCFGCGYVPPDKRNLYVYVVKPEDEIESVLLCKGCYSIKYFNHCVKNKWVTLCNSSLSQEELIVLSRNEKELKRMIEDKKIVLISKTPDKYLEEMSNVMRDERVDKVKVIFNKEFSW